MEGLTPPKYRRHEYTDELVGRAVTWSYQQGLTSMHLYSTPHSLSWIIFLENGSGGMEWSGPASYVKIRDQLYLATGSKKRATVPESGLCPAGQCRRGGGHGA